MKLIDILKRMFVERDCVICGDPISYESEEPICEDCEEDWCKLLTTRCNICGKERELCHCLPKQIKEISNGHAILICTPKVRHFWRCIFLCQKKVSNIKNTRQNSK